jgi:hypothetical protein
MAIQKPLEFEDSCKAFSNYGNNASIKEKRSGFFLIAFYFLFVTLDPTQKI